MLHVSIGRARAAALEAGADVGAAIASLCGELGPAGPFWPTPGPAVRVSPAPTEPVLTLITCDGVFDQATHDYSHRRVVRGRLIG